MCVGRLAERVRAGGPGEVVEAQAQHDGAADPVAPRAAGGRRGRRSRRGSRRAPRAMRGRRPSARCEPIDPRRRLVCTGPRDRGGGRARAGARRTPCPSSGSSGPRLELGELADGADAARVQLLGGHRADAPQPLDRAAGAGTSSSPLGRHDEQPVGLARPRSRPWRGTWCARRRPRSPARPRSRTRARSRTAISLGRARDAPQAADLEERLVDREALDERRRVVEDREHGLAGRRSRPPCAAARRPRPGTAARLPPAHRACAPRAPSPRSSRPAPPRRRRSPAARAARGRRAARPRRRTRRGRRAGSSPRRGRRRAPRLEHEHMFARRRTKGIHHRAPSPHPHLGSESAPACAILGGSGELLKVGHEVGSSA